MLTLDAIDACARAARSYPELAAALRAQGVHSYTVDVASHATLYRSMTGELLATPPRPERLPVAAVFSADATRAAIRRNQQGGSDYAGFLQDIAAAGVRRYEAVLAGPQPRCVYFGADGSWKSRSRCRLWTASARCRCALRATGAAWPPFSRRRSTSTTGGRPRPFAARRRRPLCRRRAGRADCRALQPA